MKECRNGLGIACRVVIFLFLHWSPQSKGTGRMITDETEDMGGDVTK
jgi:hypothetical protein